MHFIFGPIFSLLALRLYGIGWGLTCAMIGSSYTLVLWNNPAWFTSETLCIVAVGLWLRRGSSKYFSLVLPTALYWVTIGNLIIVSFFYATNTPWNITLVVCLKNFVNILTAAMTANIIAGIVRYWPKSKRIQQPTVPIRLTTFLEPAAFSKSRSMKFTVVNLLSNITTQNLPLLRSKPKRLTLQKVNF